MRLSRALILTVSLMGLLPQALAGQDGGHDAGHPVVRNNPRWKVAEGFHLGQAKPGAVAPSASYADQIITIDASTVVIGDFDRIWNASLDYENYKKMGMPNLVSNQIVERNPTGDGLVLWTHMINDGIPSRHFMDVQFARERGGIQWSQVRKQKHWSQVEDSAFVWLAGSLYLERFSIDKVYIRYFLRAKLKVGWPDALIGWFVENTIEKGVRDILSVLALYGQIRQ